MESLTGQETPVTYNQLNELFDSVRTILFPNFPIYDESHRIPLENLIMSKFLNREICETPYAYWQVLFNTKMNLVMNKYNPLYKAFADDINLFDDVNYTRNIKRDDIVTMEKGTKDVLTANMKNTVNGTFTPGTTQINTSINTPQSQIDDFLENKYLTSANKGWNEGTDESENISTNTGTTTTDYTGQNVDTTDGTTVETVKGKRGNKSYAEMLMEMKNNLFSVDEMVLNELEDMFFMVY